jgi:hypothetical protein
MKSDDQIEGLAMRTLIYKQTHIGDPDKVGRFGVRDCMGRIRGWDFDAVIAVGGRGSEPVKAGISGKVTWIGIGTKREMYAIPWRGPVITFARFRRFDQNGRVFRLVAPNLASRLSSARFLLIEDPQGAVGAEINKLLRLAGGSQQQKRKSIHKQKAVACR